LLPLLQTLLQPPPLLPLQRHHPSRPLGRRRRRRPRLHPCQQLLQLQAPLPLQVPLPLPLLPLLRRAGDWTARARLPGAAR
jgi:hypothetical protein